MKGNILFDCNHPLVASKASGIFINQETKNTIKNITILQIIQAIKAQIVFIKISLKFNFLGQKASCVFSTCIFLKIRNYFFLSSKKIYKSAQIVMKLSAKLNIEKYLSPIKSTTLDLKILSYQFAIAHHNISQKLKSTKLFFFAFSYFI